MTFTSFAQNFEDVILKRAFKETKTGFYIDVGAHHPITDSVTKTFYESGWRGINIEPVEHWYKLLCIDRPEDINLKLAVSCKNSMIDFFEVPDSGLSTSSFDNAEKIKKAGFNYTKTTVQAKTLTAICTEHQISEVHFLKIDVEGGERNVLKGTNFSLIRPWIILIEATEPLSSQDSSQEWDHLLLSHDYDEVYFDGLNRFYLAREHKDLKQAFRLPPNVFDDFIKYEHIEALVHVQQLREKLKSCRKTCDQRVHTLEKKIKELSAAASS